MRDSPSYRTYGHTQVLGCCTFEWSELDGRRLVKLPPAYHDGCLEELKRVAQLVGVRLEFVQEETAA